jgi:hypothetical protein
MSNFSSNSFVIEGANSAEIYEKVMNAFDLCVEVDTEYEIGKVNGKVYKISKSKPEYSDGFSYFFSVYDEIDERGLAGSWISQEDIKLKDGNLYISECCFNSLGALEYYIRNVKLHKQTNVYFSIRCEADMVGVTNDSEGKYFEKCCELLDYDTDAMIETLVQSYASKDELDKAVRYEIYEKFEKLSFDEQLSICKSLEEKGVYICYKITKVIETEKFFGA